MEEVKSQRLIETLITIGVLIGTFLAIFQMSSEVIVIFSIFIFFSLIYYISVLENYRKTLHNLLVTFMVSISFSGLFILLLGKGMIGTSIFSMIGLVIVYVLLSFLLTIELSGYSIDVKVVKEEVKSEERRKV